MIMMVTTVFCDGYRCPPRDYGNNYISSLEWLVDYWRGMASKPDVAHVVQETTHEFEWC